MRTNWKNILLLVVSFSITVLLVEGGLRLFHSFDGHFKNLTGYVFSWYGTRYLEDHKDPNKFRIVTIGDSFTYGHQNIYQESYPYILEKILNNKNKKEVEVVNLGASGRNAWARRISIYGLAGRFYSSKGIHLPDPGSRHKNWEVQTLAAQMAVDLDGGSLF